MNINQNVDINAFWSLSSTLTPKINLFPVMNVTFSTLGYNFTKKLVNGQCTFNFNYTQNKGDTREGYQQLSALIREFVHEVTGINVENFTIKEVKAFGIKKLDVLMEEYYVPEFAEDEKAKDRDFAESCNKAVGVIKAWS